MSSTSAVVARTFRIAAGQWGLLTTAQAGQVGVTRLQLARMADAGILERVDHGVYATTSSPIDHLVLRATWLALSPGRSAEERLADPVNAGVVSHASAAGLHRLGDLLDDEPEITFPHRKQSRRGVRLHRRDLADGDVTVVDGLPVTTVERTVEDLLRDGADPDHVAQIVGQALRRGTVDMTRLASRLEPSARRYGQPDGQALIEHLLDVVGLSPTALAHELVDSAVARGLVAAGGHAGGLGTLGSLADLLASLSPGRGAVTQQHLTDPAPVRDLAPGGDE